MRWNGKRAIVIVSACTSSDGTPEFALTTVRATCDQFNNGEHYELTEDKLVEQGYESPFVHFDEVDAPGFLLPAVRRYLGLEQKPRKQRRR
jgi:hypothetical protein